MYNHPAHRINSIIIYLYVLEQQVLYWLLHVHSGVMTYKMPSPEGAKYYIPWILLAGTNCSKF